MNAIPTKHGLPPANRARGRAVSNLIGQRFGRLVVTGYSHRKDYRESFINCWHCICDCGRECVRVQRALLGKHLSSCGCAIRDTQRSRPGYGNGSFNALLAAYKRAARDRGYSFELTTEEFRLLTSSQCHYCNAAPSQRLQNGKCAVYIYNGIDRADNTVGYTSTNSRPCCGTCNSAKRTMSDVEFKEWIRRVYLTCAQRDLQQEVFE